MTGRARPGSRPGPLGQGVGLSCAAANDTWKRAHQMLTLDRPVRSTSAGTGWARSPPRRGRPPGHARPRPASTARRRAQRRRPRPRRPRPRRRRRPPRRGGGAAWNGGASQCSYRFIPTFIPTEWHGSSWRYTCRPILPDHVTPGRSCGSVLRPVSDPAGAWNGQHIPADRPPRRSRRGRARPRGGRRDRSRARARGVRVHVFEGLRGALPAPRRAPGRRAGGGRQPDLRGARLGLPARHRGIRLQPGRADLQVRLSRAGRRGARRQGRPGRVPEPT